MEDHIVWDTFKAYMRGIFIQQGTKMYKEKQREREKLIKEIGWKRHIRGLCNVTLKMNWK